MNKVFFNDDIHIKIIVYRDISTDRKVDIHKVWGVVVNSEETLVKKEHWESLLLLLKNFLKSPTFK